MKKFLCFSFVLVLAGFSFAQPKDILINWECNMEIEILSGRYTPGIDTVAVRGDFNSWGRHDLVPNVLDPNIYVSEVPDTAFQVQVGQIIVNYKYFYTPAQWESGDDKVHILTQEEYDAGEATISRPFNDMTLETVTNQETTITFEVDCNSAVSYINGQPFPVVNSCRLAGGTYPLQWPGVGWPDSDIGLTLPTYDDGTHGDLTAGDKKFTTEVVFPVYTVFLIQYKCSINYGDWVNNGGGNDNEAGYANDHFIELSRYMISAKVENIFGTMGYHNLINVIVVPVELTSFTASVQSGKVSLNWSTATEVNNQGFEIERSEDNISFNKIGFVPGFGTTTEVKSYSFMDNNLTAGDYQYRLKQIDFDGSFEYSDVVEVEILTLDKFELSQNYPNPFNPSTKIKYSIPQSSNVMIKVFDILGNEIETLVNEEKPVGTYEITWYAKDLPSGIYCYKIQSGSFVETKKMILMK
jgi:hypothetical protein